LEKHDPDLASKPQTLCYYAVPAGMATRVICLLLDQEQIFGKKGAIIGN